MHLHVQQYDARPLRGSVGIRGFREAGVCAQPSLTEAATLTTENEFLSLVLRLADSGDAGCSDDALFRSIVARPCPRRSPNTGISLPLSRRDRAIPQGGAPIKRRSDRRATAFFGSAAATPRPREMPGGRNDFGKGPQAEPTRRDASKKRRDIFHSCYSIFVVVSQIFLVAPCEFNSLIFFQTGPIGQLCDSRG